MHDHAIFLALGGMLFLGLLADEIGRRTHLPRVTLLIGAGIVVGQSGFDVLPSGIQDWYAFLATTALTMVAFLLGGRLSAATLRAHGREILVVSLTVVVITTIIVAGGLILAGASVALALVLAGIATATAPAAIQDVVRQTRARGPFTDVLLGVVALDDVWGLLLFSFLLVTAKALGGGEGAALLTAGLWEVAGAIAIGAIVGLPAAFLTGRLRSGEPMQAEALGLVFLCAGLSTWLEVSFLLAGIVAGAIVVNLAVHHRRSFHEIERVEWPFMVLFFVLAGAALKIDDLAGLGWIGAAYIGLRTLSRFVGGWTGAALAGAPATHRRWIGLALTPQAGVALGMALVAGTQIPHMRETVLALTIAATVIFEILGPIGTQSALRRVGETGAR